MFMLHLRKTKFSILFDSRALCGRMPHRANKHVFNWSIVADTATDFNAALRSLERATEKESIYTVQFFDSLCRY